MSIELAPEIKMARVLDEIIAQSCFEAVHAAGHFRLFRGIARPSRRILFWRTKARRKWHADVHYGWSAHVEMYGDEYASEMESLVDAITEKLPQVKVTALQVSTYPRTEMFHTDLG